MSMFNQARPLVSSCETHHNDQQGVPLYSRRFDQVLPFHQPGLAPVGLEGVAWHICLNGEDAYASRFDRTFGFYCGVASVCKGGEWFHIRPDGKTVYSERYTFAGNFQEDKCVVCDVNSRYFHIDLNGRSLYSERWFYCGDFRDGIAVVQAENGLSSHIDASGKPVHDHWFTDLDVFHKGLARARDSLGWMHVDRVGHPIYMQRYAQVEPFYNGCSRVEAFDGSLLVIDEDGRKLRELRSGHHDSFAELSADMVGYWRTFTLGAAAELGIFDSLPASTLNLAKLLNADPERLRRLLCALAELNMVMIKEDVWQATKKGEYLSETSSMSLKSAAVEYSGDLLERWRNLPGIVRGQPVNQYIFSTVANDPERCSRHHRMLASYALNDYVPVLDFLEIGANDIVFDAAGGNGTLSRLLAVRYPAASIICGDMRLVLNSIDQVQTIDFDLFEPWPVQSNKVLLARVLHDWSDVQAVEILKNARASLLPEGEVIILEMLLPDNSFSGALCDLHLLTVTGGKERCLTEYQTLLSRAGFLLSTNITGPGLVSVLKAKVAVE